MVGKAEVRVSTNIENRSSYASEVVVASNVYTQINGNTHQVVDD